ncbi:MAG TPA: outer membrane protein assembly factor BamD [Patescibacteria group bacterium]|nr:outer membrane protein assembly factor BamD [Patescibacteria group bacterium]
MPSVFIRILLSIFAVSWLLAGCASTSTPETGGPENIFNLAKSAYADEDYLEAQRLFDVVKLQYPASQFADDAQYYLAEINFKREEYVLAAFAYTQLRRSYPNSEYYREALFKTALSYYQLSPTYDRDQEYTRRAIQSFADYQMLYAGDSLANESTAKIRELRNKLAQREFSTAELYLKLESPKSAVIYFDAVINDYSDTDFYEQAIAGKAEALSQLRNTEEARRTVDLYVKNFPQGKFRGRMDELAAQLPRR